MSLLAELRRRNVIRMAGLYLVGAWLITQVAATLLPVFHAPDWLLRAIVILLCVGFVPSLIVAWVFELTPDGLKRDADVPVAESIAPQTARRMERWILVLFALALMVFAFDRFVLAPRREAALVMQTTEQVTAKVAEAKLAVNSQSIAVLPFVNMSEDKNNEFFSDGISEELLNVLVRVDGLSVASRTSSFAYKDREMSSAAIAKDLKVKYILEGSVRKQGDKVRITAQLIDSADDRHLWSETYDRELADIFEVQDEIANAIVRQVRGSIGNSSTGRSVTVRADTENLSAYEAYLKARELFIARSDLNESARLFERSVELDPKFARGWEGLAAVYSVLPSWGIVDRDYYALTGRAARRALELDKGLSMAWAALANAENSGKSPADFDSITTYLNRAIVADPNNATAYLWRGISWLRLGFFDRGLADLNRCLALDPAYKNCIRWKAWGLLVNGDEQRAVELFEQGLATGYVANRAPVFAAIYYRRGNHAAARLLMLDQGMSSVLAERMLAAVAELGAPPKDLDGLERRMKSDMENKVFTDFSYSQLYLWFGAFDRVTTATDLSNSNFALWTPVRPDFRNTPGFKKTAERLGLLAYWRKHGFPPQCRAQGANDFTCDAPAVKRDK